MIAVISDVHGNLAALESVLESIDARHITRIWCLGDTLGYGPHPNECMSLVAARCELVLAGNHDLAVRGDLSQRMFGGTAGIGVAYARSVMTDGTRAALAGLKAFAFRDEAECYHASANDWVWEYVRDVPVATRHLATQRAQLSLVGHSHMQLAFTLPAGARQAYGGHGASGDVIPIVPDGKVVLNPGSVGQPRDRDPRAAWALLEPGVGVRFERVEYDVARTRAAVDAAGLPSEIGERLEVGR